VSKERVLAFSDAVTAILITIMVLEVHIPEEATLHALESIAPTLASYLLSFILVGIYWNNHHHLYQAVERVSGNVLWANSHLLFWLSLIPFGMGWMGAHPFARVPTACYGFVLLICSVAYEILVRSLLTLHGKDSLLVEAIGDHVKGILSVVICLISVPVAFVLPWLADALYVLIACMWFIPIRRIEKRIADEAPAEEPDSTAPELVAGNGETR